MKTLHPVEIVGIGTYFPERVVRNEDFELAKHHIQLEWPEKMGLAERRWAADDEDIFDLGEKAAARAIRDAAIDPREIDQLYFSSASLRDKPIAPSALVSMQHRIGADRAVSAHLLETCAGALFALDLAANAVACGMAQKVLVVASDAYSKHFNGDNAWTTKIGLNFGDGAAALVVSRGKGEQCARISSTFHSDPAFQSGLGIVPMIVDGAAALRLGFASFPPTFRGEKLAPDQALEALRQFTTESLARAAKDALSEAELTAAEVDFFALHQPNGHYLQSWAELIGIPADKTTDTLARYGNLLGVSVFANLQAGLDAGLLEQGSTVLMAAIGAGSTYGASLWRWTSAGASGA